MIPRNELLDLLRQKLHPSLPQDQIENLAGEILALEDEWEEMDIPHRDMGYSHNDSCSNICWLANQTEQGSIVKFFRKKK